MKTVQLQKHVSSNFSANLILAQVHFQNHSAGDVTRVSKITVKINGWRGYRLFYLLSCTVYSRGNRLKINITPCGESSIIQLTELTHICLVDFFLLHPLDEFISNFRGVYFLFLFYF